MKKVLFIVNLRSGIDRVKPLQKDIEAHLDPQKFTYELVYTEYAKHGALLAEEGVKKGFEVIVAVGGDGSVNDVARGIYGTDVVLGIIPKGSGNGVARSLHIPLKETEAIRLINTYKIADIDVGSADDHLFIGSAGVGFDTVVTEKFSRSARRGFLSYLSIIIESLWGYVPREWHLEADGEQLTKHAFMLTTANVPQLGYGFEIAPDAQPDDGCFDLVSVRKFPVFLAAAVALRAFTGRIKGSPYVETLRTKNIKIYHPDLNLLQFDGEAVKCSNTVVIKMMPKKLKLLIS